ncbi:hypothetical protein V2G26_005590 [Clonostachys chloroleuca]
MASSSSPSTPSYTPTSSLASLILPKIEHTTAQKLTYTHGQHQIHYVAESFADHADQNGAGGLTFLVIADSSLGRRVPFGFLFEVRKRFFAQFPVGSYFADMPNYGAASFNGELKNLMGHHDQEHRESAGEGERLDLLVDKTDRLGGSARDFRVRSRGLKRQMWWKNVKLMALLALVVILIILGLVVALKN